MPRIELIDVPLYNPTDPYHFEIDNIPLRSLIKRQELINLSLDNVLEEIRDAIGTQGSMANRLNQSIEQDGSLKTVAIDDALHSIESHADTDDFVRMLREESEKLTLVADEATDLTLEFQNEPGSEVDFDSDEVRFRDSETITWRVMSPNMIFADMVFPTSAAHQHHYSQVPVHEDMVDPDFINYKANSGSTSFVNGSLRIYVNGVRINETEAIYVPGPLVDDPWMLLSFTSDYAAGTFALSAAISEDDVIIIDYDIALA
jgi:hypothetical protein